jgi:hypothetical protein
MLGFFPISASALGSAGVDDGSALNRQAINGTDYQAEFPSATSVKIKSLAAQNLKVRVL